MICSSTSLINLITVAIISWQRILQGVIDGRDVALQNSPDRLGG